MADSKDDRIKGLEVKLESMIEMYNKVHAERDEWKERVILTGAEDQKRIAELEAEVAEAWNQRNGQYHRARKTEAEVARLREANRAACDALGWIKNHDGSPPSFRMAAENALRVQNALAGGGQ